MEENAERVTTERIATVIVALGCCGIALAAVFLFRSYRGAAVGALLGVTALWVWKRGFFSTVGGSGGRPSTVHQAFGTHICDALISVLWLAYELVDLWIGWREPVYIFWHHRVLRIAFWSCLLALSATRYARVRFARGPRSDA
jgi:hypothetical protein